MLSRRSAEIAARFDARAGSYELHAGLQRAVADKLARFLPPLDAPRVLELGCGTGLFSRHLIDRYPDGSFVLTDTLGRSFDSVFADGFDLEARGEEFYRHYIALALERAGGVQTKAAELLGMSFRSFRYYAKKFNLR